MDKKIEGYTEITKGKKNPSKICTHLYTSAIPVLGKQRQEDFSKLEVRLHSDSRPLSGSVKELML